MVLSTNLLLRLMLVATGRPAPLQALVLVPDSRINYLAIDGRILAQSVPVSGRSPSQLARL